MFGRVLRTHHRPDGAAPSGRARQRHQRCLWRRHHVAITVALAVVAFFAVVAGGDVDVTATSAAKLKRHRATASVASVAPCANVSLIPTAANIALVETATVCQVNQFRGEHGLPALQENSDLQQAADQHNNDMIARNYFDHTDPSGGTPLTRIEATGYIANKRISYLIGENIAWATLSLSTPAAIVTAWINSPDHRANMLNGTFTQTGLAVAPEAPASLASGQPGAIYTQDFGGVAHKA